MIKNKILITGASSKIGQYIVLKLAQSLQYEFILHYNNSAGTIKKLSESLADLGVKSYSIQCDFRQSQQLKGFFDQVQQYVDKVDILINNAGIMALESDHQATSSSVYLENMQINYYAPYVLGEHFNNCFLKNSQNKGVIINMLDSTIDQKSSFWQYDISKSLAKHLTKHQAIRYSPHIRVNAVAPYMVAKHQRQSNKSFNKLAIQNLLQYSTTLEDVYQAIHYLLHAQSVTGSVMFVDGGQHLLGGTI